MEQGHLSQDHQVSLDPLVNNVNHAEFRETLHMLPQDVSAEATIEFVALVNPNVNSRALRLSIFSRVNLSVFNFSKWEQYPKFSSKRSIRY